HLSSSSFIEKPVDGVAINLHRLRQNSEAERFCAGIVRTVVRCPLNEYSFDTLPFPIAKDFCRGEAGTVDFSALEGERSRYMRIEIQRISSRALYRPISGNLQTDNEIPVDGTVRARISLRIRRNDRLGRNVLVLFDSHSALFLNAVLAFGEEPRDLARSSRCRRRLSWSNGGMHRGENGDHRKDFAGHRINLEGSHL